MTIDSAVGLLGASLLLAAAGVLVVRRWNLAPRRRAGAVLLLLVAGWLPVRELPLAGYVRGVIGDLSVTTLLLLAVMLFSYVTGRRLIDPRERAVWFAALAIGASALYPTALGLGPLDPYALGYGSFGFVTFLLALSIIAWRANCLWIVFGAMIAVAAHLLRLLDSANLWDYFMDPLVAGYAILWWAQRAGRALLARVRASA
jgi:hypothetical protein